MEFLSSDIWSQYLPFLLLDQISLLAPNFLLWQNVPCLYLSISGTVSIYLNLIKFPPWLSISLLAPHFLAWLLISYSRRVFPACIYLYLHLCLFFIWIKFPTLGWLPIFYCGSAFPACISLYLHLYIFSSSGLIFFAGSQFPTLGECSLPVSIYIWHTCRASYTHEGINYSDGFLCPSSQCWNRLFQY